MSGHKPTFIVLGAPKCATTALYATLRHHPQVCMSLVKETRYFAFEAQPPVFVGPGAIQWNQRVIATWEAYLNLFACANKETMAIGEVSPVYLTGHFPARTAANIHRRLPDVQLIAVLRQPADRAYSNFTFLRGKGREPLADFRQALMEEPARKAVNWTPGFYYRENGAYYTHLKPYFALFSPEKIRIILYDDLLRQPDTCLTDLYDFIGVNSALGPTELHHANVTRWPRSWTVQAWLNAPPWIVRRLPVRIKRPLLRRLKAWNDKQIKPPSLDPALRRELTESYRDEILRLQDLIGRDLGHWLAMP